MLNGPVGVRTRCHHHKAPVTEEAFHYITTTDICLIINATSQPVSVLVTSMLEQQSRLLFMKADVINAAIVC